MKLSELFRTLSFGELSNLAISNSGSGQIVQAKWPQLISYTKTALTALHSRFVLREEDSVIEQMAWITNYELTSKHSESTGDEDDDLYIKDTEEAPFSDDLIKVLEVWNETGHRYALNDREADYSLFTPKPNVLQVPEPIDGQPLSIVYQADHPKLIDELPEGEEDTSIILDQIIDIPHYLHNALHKRVAAEVFSHMNGQENILKGQEYLAAYEADCRLVEQSDLANQTTHTSHSKLESRGFV